MTYGFNALSRKHDEALILDVTKAICYENELQENAASSTTYIYQMLCYIKLL